MTTTKCNKPYRIVCNDRKHPDGCNYLVLITRGNEEIAVAARDLSAPIKSQWFPEEIYL